MDSEIDISACDNDNECLFWSKHGIKIPGQTLWGHSGKGRDTGLLMVM